MYDTLRDFLDDTCIDTNESYPVTVFDFSTEEQIFDGDMNCIPYEMLKMKFSSWEFLYFENKICFNVESEE